MSISFPTCWILLLKSNGHNWKVHEAVNICRITNMLFCQTTEGITKNVIREERVQLYVNINLLPFSFLFSYINILIMLIITQVKDCSWNASHFKQNYRHSLQDIVYQCTCLFRVSFDFIQNLESHPSWYRPMSNTFCCKDFQRYLVMNIFYDSKAPQIIQLLLLFTIIITNHSECSGWFRLIVQVTCIHSVEHLLYSSFTGKKDNNNYEEKKRGDPGRKMEY